MKTHLKIWNNESLLWKIDSFDNFWAGEYLLAENSNARDKRIKHHTISIDKVLLSYPPESTSFLANLKRRFITFEEYLALISGKGLGSNSASNFASAYWNLINQPQFNLLLPASDDHETNYLELLQKALPQTKSLFFSPQPVPVPIGALKRHLLITGRSGSGKTEFLKSLFYQLQHRTHLKQQASLILLDPHGDLSEHLFSLALNIQKPERLWYIDPTWDNKKIPCINPFWQAVRDPVLIDLMAQQWAKAFAELIPEIGVTLPMETILKPCLAVMFERGECGLSDLQLFMDDTLNGDWVELGRKSSNPVFRQFFESAFLNKKYSLTKMAVYTRLQHLLNNYVFYQVMNGKSSLDLKKGMQEGKVILFNLSKGKLGEDTSRALGRFVSATLLSIALQRAFESEKNRKSCYLFIDEFQNVASSSTEVIFSEARKYHLHLIVGTQTVGQLPTSLKDMVLNNTAVKLVGLNGLPALKSQAGDIGVSYAQLQHLPPYHFYLKYDHYPALKVKSPDALLRNSNKYFASEKQKELLTKHCLEKSGLYRERSAVGTTRPQNNSSIPADSADLDSNTSSHNASASASDFTPEFGL